MVSQFRWQHALWLSALALALGWLIRADFTRLNAVSELSMQGSPPPALDAGSPTGYALGQRHFLGTHERGETYRWIAATQDFIASGPFASPVYTADTVPTGRPQLLPKLYTAWLAAVAWSLHLVTGESIALSVERAALWEPLISHLLMFVAGVAWLGRRHGLPGAAVAALFIAFFPPLSGQFLPGVLGTRTWALLLAAYSLALLLPSKRDGEQPPFTFPVASAIAAALALWLDPAFGFPAVLLAAVAGATTILSRLTIRHAFRWSLVGGALTLLAWLLNQNPFSVAAGELRYVHPWYALAWLGLGLALHGVQSLRTTTSRRALRFVEIAAGVLLFTPLAYVQLQHDYPGWLYSSVGLRRLTSLDETVAFNTFADWLARASAAEILFVTALPLAALALVVTLALRCWTARNATPLSSLAPIALTFAGVCVLAFFRVRWGVVAAVVAVPLVWHLATRDFAAYRKTRLATASAFLAGLVVWSALLSPTFQHSPAGREASPADVEALVHRHFSHWLATHTPERSVAALAPPELSDSIIFHGGGRALMSTAWESYPGQVATTRILSALESTEAEAVLEGHELTHVILPSWDKVLPLFVQKPTLEGKDTLFDRLNRWVAPPYFRPLSYRLPPMPGFAAEKLAVFQMTPPEDEALSLSRLAEYFVEMERPEPATLAARILAEAYPNDPNAAIARATVYAETKNAAGFDRELTRLAADIDAGRTPFSWDRRVQRAIVLALGRRTELARKEVTACIATATRAEIFELTPLQAYRLQTLVRGFRLSFDDPSLFDLLGSLGARFSAAPTASASERR